MSVNSPGRVASHREERVRRWSAGGAWVALHYTVSVSVLATSIMLFLLGAGSVRGLTSLMVISAASYALHAPLSKGFGRLVRRLRGQPKKATYPTKPRYGTAQPDISSSENQRLRKTA
ncbi:MAG: hypothetical protein ACRDOJ_04005 [Nocardioidaceae bacterium]